MYGVYFVFSNGTVESLRRLACGLVLLGKIIRVHTISCTTRGPHIFTSMRFFCTPAHSFDREKVVCKEYGML